MKYIYNKLFKRHNEELQHPECKERLSFFDSVAQTEILDGASFLDLVHTQSHIDLIKRISSQGGQIDADTFANKYSFDVAQKAVGAAIQASEGLDFAIVRPPGHHAYADMASGFCLFNSIAVATQKLSNEGKRVFILDFDGHCGDGTYDIFKTADKILFASIHQFPAFPNKGTVHDIGEGVGKGHSLCIPVPPESGDDVLMDAIKLSIHIAEQFEPDIVAVSAGFDGHREDPLLQLNYSTSVFHQIGALLFRKFESVFAVLEGGYNTIHLPRCAENFKAGMNGKAKVWDDKHTRSTQQVIDEYKVNQSVLKDNLKSYWTF